MIVFFMSCLFVCFDCFAQWTGAHEEPRIISIRYDDSSGPIVIAGRINMYNVKTYFSNSSANCTISSLQASMLLKDGVIKLDNIKGDVAAGIVSPGSKVTIPRLYLGGVPFSNVRFVVSDNMSYPIVISYRLIQYKGDLYIDPDNKAFIIVPPDSSIII